ncbi:chorismate--pyruvate lyase family protein [Marinospirillum alkaliphilum]|uniref:Probable chorismate pyruvate-lyase n=1 Tax=Marinospirillum alkaliphilum DSM 21637 TaxID=1122209 RepID=A0A1K1WLC4_9GAMM|nr:chorismate lyase [Marinospirillum alkaliphilum]SFX37931.1 chorismate lyase [Marinospirillum alkaliphilum DSM 21637]
MHLTAAPLKIQIQARLQQLDGRLPPRWLPSSHLTGAPAGAWRSWLQEQGSLTLRLQSQARQGFRVRVLSEGVSRVHPQEAQLLQAASHRVWVRQVLLEVDDQPWVFARSLLPLDDRGLLRRRILQVGNRALGHILFSDPLIERGPLMFCAPGQLPFDSLWGRASCFYGEHLRLLVAEHYLQPMAERLALPTLPYYATALMQGVTPS